MKRASTARSQPFSSPRLDLSGRVWLMVLFKGLSAGGLLPIPRMRLHRILYLSQALAPIFAAKAPRVSVLKFHRGPFFPEAQWDIDRLAVSGLLEMKGIRYAPNSSWIDSDYDLTRQGYELVDRLFELPSCRNLRDFLAGLAASYSTVSDEKIDEAPLHDLNYAAPATPNGALIEFETRDENESLRTAEYFSRLWPAELPPNRKEQLYYYIKLLERRATWPLPVAS